MRKRRQAAKEEKIEPKKKVAKEVGTTAIDGSSMLPVVSAKTWTNVIEKEPVNRVRLGSTFYDQDCIELAKALLGKTLVREIDGLRLAGRIVETEAYLGVKDSACHSYGGRKSHRNQAMFMTPGSLYVYLIYGMYYCTNISSKDEGSVVLLRALEPLEGSDLMQTFRSSRRKTSKELKKNALCSGPGKLSDALKVTKELFDKESLLSSTRIWIEDAPVVPPESIVCCPRVGLDNCSAESRDKLQRYYVLGSRFISKRNRDAEQVLKDIVW